LAWGEELRIRVDVQVDQPLLQGVSLKESEEDAAGKWFDLQYEKIRHFCFAYGHTVRDIPTYIGSVVSGSDIETTQSMHIGTFH
jgi:hypothetical protein